jgi:NADH-quinone oxidoreductase subunit C
VQKELTKWNNAVPIDDVKIALSGIAVQAAAEHVAEGAPVGPLVVATDRAGKGTDLEATVPADRVADAALVMCQARFALESITGIDWIAEQRMEVVYDYVHFGSGQRVTVRAFVPREAPEVPTLSTICPGAEWHERETRDFFGIFFTGHPDPTPLLLPEDTDFHPLRKDFQK